MTWGKMDDKFHRNRKVRDLRKKGKAGREALGTWAFWWSWCLDDPELNGIVPACELSSGEISGAALLVEAGLWDEVPGGYAFHDFHEYNPTRSQIEAKRRADRERVADKRGATRANVARDTEATILRVASTRVPSHPIPTNPERENPPSPPGGGFVVDPEPYRESVSASRAQECRDAWGQAWSEARAGTLPRLPPATMAAAVAFAADVAQAHGKPLRDAALEIARAAVRQPADRRPWGLCQLDPFAPSSPLPGPANGRPGRVQRAASTTAADFADEPDAAELSRRLGWGGKS